jgi:hypothetical protein
MSSTTAMLPRCRVPLNYAGTYCDRDVFVPRGSAPLDECILHTRDPRRDSEQFNVAVRSALTDDAERDTDDLSGILFPDQLNLGGLTFRRKVFFDRSEFIGYVSFLHTIFENDVFFNEVKFRGTTQFTAAKFRRQVSFADAIFSNEARFARVKFSGRSYFLRTRFDGGVTFRLGIAENVVVIDECSVGVAASDASSDNSAPILDLSEVRIHDAGGFHLVNVNNAVQPLRLRVLNSLLDGCRFEDVNWFRIGGRLTLHEETELAAAAGRHELVKISYDRLTALFDDTRSYDLAEECFIGAMEVARRNPRTGWWHRAWLNGYRAISRYGTRYDRALMWLILTIVAFAIVYASPVVELRPTDTGPTQGTVQAVSRTWDRLASGLLHSLQSALLARQPTYRPTYRLGLFLTAVEPVPVAVFSALFLLAIRRRFHRGH